MTTARTAIQNWLRSRGYDIVKYRPPFEHPFDVLGMLIRDALPRVSAFRFLQIGAADGELNDPLRPSILRHGLSGVLVEPLPDQFARLRESYAGRSAGITFVQAAIGERDGTATMYRIRPDAPLPFDVQQLASFDRRNLTTARQGVAGLDAHIEAIAVPTRSMASLVAEHGLQDLSLLVTDCEGFDGVVIQDALSIGLRPRVVMYESVHLSAETQRGCLLALRDCGYRFVEIGMDTYAVRDEA